MSFSATLVRCSKKHSPSSKRWLQRQYRDPLVKMRNAHPVIYRSRSAFKLLDLDSKFNFLVHSDVQTVIDLGAAPGGWSQVVSGKLGWVVEDVVSSRSLKKAKDLGYQSETLYAGFGLEEKSKSDKYGSWSSPNQEATQDLDIYSVLDEEEQVQQGRGTIIAVDILPISPIPGVKTLQMDFLTRQAEQYINALIEDREDPNAVGKADVVLSDIAANFSGNRTRDVASNLQVAEAVFAFAKRHLKTAKESGRTRGGVLVMKYFDHPYLERFKKEFLSPHFRWCYHCKPESSRRESAEGYWVCLGFNGVDGS